MKQRCILIFLASLLLTPALTPAQQASPKPSDTTAAVRDYTYSCWLNGWRKNATDYSADIFGVETSFYGFTLDVADFSKVGFGRLNNTVGYEQALEHKAEKLKKLPSAVLLIELEVDGLRYRAQACKAGQEKGVKHLQDAQLWESGRYVQHYKFQGLDFRNSKDEKLACSAILDLVAWPGNLTFTLNTSAGQSYQKATLRLGLKSEAGSWQQELTVEDVWGKGQQKSLTMTCPVVSGGTVDPAKNISVHTAGGQSIPVRFDPQKNCYVAAVTNLKRSWADGYTDIRDYDDFKITINDSGSKGMVPFLLDMRPPANISGLVPILCDEEGRPTGIPVQLSKNWHDRAMGLYLMAYAMLPAEKSATYLLRVNYGFYGTLPAASHAQLCLLGYSASGNGRWDQLAIGSWGETICFDMDNSLVDVAITDIRMLLTRKGINGRKWTWSEAGWGGDWLNIQDAGQKKYLWTELKTAYLAHGPCLTDVKYEGFYGANREVDFSAQLQTLRTDDYCRTFQKLNYTFTRDVSPQKIWLYKLGRTRQYRTPQIAYGNSDGLLSEKDAPNTLKAGQLVVNNVTLAGIAPYWVAFPGGRSTGNKPDGYRALIVRQYKVVAGGKTYLNPTFSAPVYKADPTNLDIELLPPTDVTQFHKGDRIELDLELITLPREADDYFGPNEAFRQHLTDNPNSWKTTYREAKGNDLVVEVTGGRALHNYPLIIQAEKPEVTVAIKGGVGVVPIRFEGLQSNQGYCLYRVNKGQRVKLDQSVHGHDFWQTDYDAATRTYKMSFNLPLDGVPESQWVLARD